MAPNVLRELMKAAPFQPFTIHMTDGRSVYIPSPEFIAIKPGSGRTIFVWEGNHRFQFLDSILIARIELASAPPLDTASGNGQTVE